MQFLYNSTEIRDIRTFIYVYNENYIRIVKVKSCRKSGFEEIKKTNDSFIDVNSEESKRCSLSRSKRNIREIAFCNGFTHFATLTVDSLKADRYNLEICQKKLKKTLEKIKRKNKDFRYIFITEKHKDNAFHFHGLVKGIENDLYKNDFGYYSSHILSNNLGFNSFSKIRDYNKCCNYITKYITKDCIKNEHNQIYISSKGLVKASKEEIKNISFIPSYENDYVQILDIDLLTYDKKKLFEIYKQL